MTPTQNLKKEIIQQYGNLRRFSLEIGIPYSSLVSMLGRGAYSMSYGAMTEICSKLKLDPIEFMPLKSSGTVNEQLLEKHIMGYFSRLNQEGKDKMLELMEIYTQIEKYER